MLILSFVLFSKIMISCSYEISSSLKSGFSRFGGIQRTSKNNLLFHHWNHLTTMFHLHNQRPQFLHFLCQHLHLNRTQIIYFDFHLFSVSAKKKNWIVNQKVFEKDLTPILFNCNKMPVAMYVRSIIWGSTSWFFFMFEVEKFPA